MRPHPVNLLTFGLCMGSYISSASTGSGVEEPASSALIQPISQSTRMPLSQPIVDEESQHPTASATDHDEDSGSGSDWDASDDDDDPGEQEQWATVRPSALNMMTGRLYIVFTVFVLPNDGDSDGDSSETDRRMLPIIHIRKYESKYSKTKEPILIPTKIGVAFTAGQLRKLFSMKAGVTDALTSKLKRTFRTQPGDSAVRLSTVKQDGVMSLRLTKNGKSLTVSVAQWMQLAGGENIILQKLERLEDHLAGISPWKYEHMLNKYGGALVKDNVEMLKAPMKSGKARKNAAASKGEAIQPSKPPAVGVKRKRATGNGSKKGKLTAPADGETADQQSSRQRDDEVYSVDDDVDDEATGSGTQAKKKRRVTLQQVKEVICSTCQKTDSPMYFLSAKTGRDICMDCCNVESKS